MKVKRLLNMKGAKFKVEGKLFAECRVWKQVYCPAKKCKKCTTNCQAYCKCKKLDKKCTNSCQVRKNIECVKVCRLLNNSFNMKHREWKKRGFRDFDPKACDASLCKQHKEFGDLACRAVSL